MAGGKKAKQMPFGFIGDTLELTNLEKQIMHTPRDMSNSGLSLFHANLIVILQALHRTQQHRTLTHRAAEDVATVLGFGTPDGTKAVARIIDHFCSTRLAFNRVNREKNEHYQRSFIHVLVDEEIRWRYTLGTKDPQIVYPKLSQPQAKARYLADTKELIRKHFKSLLFKRMPCLDDPGRSASNQTFGVLKDIG